MPACFIQLVNVASAWKSRRALAELRDFAADAVTACGQTANRVDEPETNLPSVVLTLGFCASANASTDAAPLIVAIDSAAPDVLEQTTPGETTLKAQEEVTPAANHLEEQSGETALVDTSTPSGDTSEAAGGLVGALKAGKWVVAIALACHRSNERCQPWLICYTGVVPTVTPHYVVLCLVCVLVVGCGAPADAPTRPGTKTVGPPTRARPVDVTSCKRGSWSEPVPLDSGFSSSGMDLAGAVVVWDDSEIVRASTLDPRKKLWLTEDIGHSDNWPVVAAAGERAMAAWMLSSATYASRHHLGEWEQAFRLCVPAQSCGSPSLVLDSVGNATVAWDLDSQVFVRRMNAEGKWQGIVSVSDESREFQILESLATNRAGDVVVAWSQGPLEQINLLESHLDQAGAWTPPAQIERDSDGAFVGDIDLAWLSPDQLLATWWQSDGQHLRIMVSEQASDGGWATPSPLVVEEREKKLRQPTFATNENGHAAIGWYETSGRTVGLRIARFDPVAQEWQSPPLVAREVIHYDDEPQLGMDACGNLSVVWSGVNGITARRLETDDEQWSAEHVLADGEVFAPQLSVRQGGEVLVAWQWRRDGFQPFVAWWGR